MANWYDNVPAPVDANGREVPLDTKKLVYKGKTRGVVSIVYDIAIGVWIVVFDGVVECPHLTSCTLPDSWERLELDAVKDPCKYFGMVSSVGCKGCPAKSDDDNLLMCHVAMTLDIIRRAKALAGVADGE